MMKNSIFLLLCSSLLSDEYKNAHINNAITAEINIATTIPRIIISVEIVIVFR